jgi:hypothetical protein
VAAATLAHVIDDGGWEEALLCGTLGRARLCLLGGGRVRLRPLAARFLDGRPAKLRIVQPPAGATPAPLDGSRRLDAQRLDEAAALAERLGRPLAFIDAATVSVEAALAEARLAGIVPLVNGSNGVEEWAPLVAEQVVLCADDEPPPALSALPPLE